MRNVRVVQDVYAAFGRGDVVTVLGEFDRKLEWRNAEGNPHEPSGKACLAARHGRLADHWSGLGGTPPPYRDRPNALRFP